jgi:hypothetical protein
MENNNRQGCRWVNGNKKELWPGIDNSDSPEQYLIRVKGDDPRSGWVHTEYCPASEFIYIKEDYWEWLDESPIEPCATSSENHQDELVAWLTTFDNWTKMEAFRFVEKMSKVFDIKKK